MMIERIHREYSKYLNCYKQVRILFPESYFKDLHKRYPVFYFHDGQNLVHRSPFSNSSWGIKKTFKDLNIEAIVVGIDSNKNRVQEYCPFRPIDFKGKFTSKAYEYGQFITEELKPIIDKKLRTLSDYEHTFIGGSSYGAVISLYISATFKGIFSLVMSFSLASWPFLILFNDYIRLTKLDEKAKYQICVGTKEEDINYNKEMCHQAYLYCSKLLKDYLDFKNINNELTIYQDGRHSERDWSKQLADVLVKEINRFR